MNELQNLIEMFGERNERVKSLKKETDVLNTQIKEIMATLPGGVTESEHFTARYSVSVTESFDEPKLIERLKQLGCHGVIKTVEVVDMDALENAIYNGHIAGSELADCKVSKSTPKLVVSVKKAKKEKKNED
jgi:hypothetical protein